jgi:hypothetical protein
MPTIGSREFRTPSTAIPTISNAVAVRGHCPFPFLTAARDSNEKLGSCGYARTDKRAHQSLGACGLGVMREGEQGVASSGLC